MPEAEIDEPADFEAIVFGSPTRFGPRAAQLSNFLDQTGPRRQRGALAGRPCGFFTGASTLHGGHESTVHTRSTYDFHHGMSIGPVGYVTTDATMATRTGGGPYGPSHWSPQGDDEDGLSDDEIAIAESYGERITEITMRLAA